MEHIVGLRYKLQMFGIPIKAGPAHILCDNQAMVKKSSKLESVLNKKHCTIAYHAVCWAVTAGILRVGKIETKENLADAMTKRLARIKRDYLFGNWTYELNCSRYTDIYRNSWGPNQYAHCTRVNHTLHI